MALCPEDDLKAKGASEMTELRLERNNTAGVAAEAGSIIRTAYADSLKRRELNENRSNSGLLS